MQDYHLYRAKFIPSAQYSLLTEKKSSSEVFLEAILDKPELTLRAGSEWRIGNIERVENLYGSFAIGRTTKTPLGKYDEDSGDFVDTMDDAAPYTRVIFDVQIGLLAIAKKTKLAADPDAIAKKIEYLFEKTKAVIETGVDVQVDVIPDPQPFLERLRSAYAVTKFKATFTGPNPVDADEIFQRPLSVYAQKMDADKGAVEVQGKSLDQEVAAAVAKSTAATGNTASARIIPEKGKTAMSITMKGGGVVVPIAENAPLKDIISRVREVYARVRG